MCDVDEKEEEDTIRACLRWTLIRHNPTSYVIYVSLAFLS